MGVGGVSTYRTRIWVCVSFKESIYSNVGFYSRIYVDIQLSIQAVIKDISLKFIHSKSWSKTIDSRLTGFPSQLGRFTCTGNRPCTVALRFMVPCAKRVGPG